MWLFLRFVHFNINFLLKNFSANVFKMPAFSLFKIGKNPYNGILSSHKLKKKKRKYWYKVEQDESWKTLKEASHTLWFHYDSIHMKVQKRGNVETESKLVII